MIQRLLFIPILFLVLATSSFAAEGAPPDFSSLTTADEFWKQMEKLQEVPSEAPNSREEAVAQMKTWLKNQQLAAEAFVQKFPSDPRVWQARMVVVRVEARMRDMVNDPGDPKPFREKLDEIINAPGASAAFKGEAAFLKVRSLTDDIRKDKPETFGAFYKAADEFYQKYPDHPVADQLKTLQMQVLNQDPTEEGAATLKKLASGSDPRLAATAKNMIESRQKMADLRSKPIEIKFTSADGHDIDLANYRGKVVLVDFWASWCGPCMAEMPNVVSTYGKLHEKGFEIVGISLDQEKEAMEGALKKQKMTWPQYFDGAGWQNKIASTFGIQSIPAAWLIDKKGMVRETGLRGEALGEAIGKLLAE